MRPDQAEARHWKLGGRVQGVGFRPFVYRLATRHRLRGWVRNSTGEVEVFATGGAADLANFGTALLREAPDAAQPRLISVEPASPQDVVGFAVLNSDSTRPQDVQLPLDRATCDACLTELRDPANRRHRYPFITCTQCGPRYTLIRTLPYDRRNTTQAQFPLCPACQAEYDDPADRRFHAETIACAVCGPRLECEGSTGEQALQVALAGLRNGMVVAVKGIGGYHLMCDARDEAVVRRLRDRKRRPHKPLAVMLPACDGHADAVQPINLLPRAQIPAMAPSVAPGLREIGVMHPYSPLHHLLLDGFGGPLVATSGNVSNEPVLIDNAAAADRLAGIADLFLHHDRPIARPADDSVFRSIAGIARPLRLGRGMAPVECVLPAPLSQPTLALGGHGKNTVALGWGQRAVISPHLGDMDSPAALVLLRQTVEALQAMHGVDAQAIACDAHPGYATTRLARTFGLPVLRVPHHRAHAAALAAEHDGAMPWLMFTWDGAGFGEDGTIWGGEALLGHPGAWRRVASLRSFALLGGESAAREPWRSAVSLCWEIGESCDVDGRDLGLLRHAWQRGLNCPRSSSAGRLFDAAAACLGLIEMASHEGEAAMLLEAACTAPADALQLPISRREGGLLISDWAALLRAMRDHSRPVAERAALFHATLAGIIRDQAVALRAVHGAFRVGLTGGVLQNRVLAELALDWLRAEGFASHLPQDLPCNDAGLSFGQLVEAACR